MMRKNKTGLNFFQPSFALLNNW